MLVWEPRRPPPATATASLTSQSSWIAEISRGVDPSRLQSEGERRLSHRLEASRCYRPTPPLVKSSDWSALYLYLSAASVDLFLATNDHHSVSSLFLPLLSTRQAESDVSVPQYHRSHAQVPPRPAGLSGPQRGFKVPLCFG